MKKILIAAALLSAATPAFAGGYKYSATADADTQVAYTHGNAAISATVGTSYVTVMPTMDGTGRPAFAVMITNGGDTPFDFMLEHATATYADGTPIRIYSNTDLENKAKSTAFWSAVVAGMAASANSTSYGTTTVRTPYGKYTSHSSYSNAYARNAELRESAAEITARQQDRMTEISNVVDRDTLNPGSDYSGLIVTQKLESKAWPASVNLTLNVNGVSRTFVFQVAKK